MKANEAAEKLYRKMGFTGDANDEVKFVIKHAHRFP